MTIDANSALDNLARLVQAISDDAILRQTFYGMAKMSPSKRLSQIHTMAERLGVEHEPAEFVASFRLLADARIFDAAMVALRDLGYKSEGLNQSKVCRFAPGVIRSKLRPISWQWWTAPWRRLWTSAQTALRRGSRRWTPKSWGHSRS